MSAPRATLLLLTEDSGRDAHATHEALVRSMLRLIAPRHNTSAIVIDGATDDQRSVMRNNGWESRKPENESKRRSLLQSIATKLCESNLHIVFFHYDGDRPWSDHESYPRKTMFDERVILAIKHQFDHKNLSPEQQERALSRLITIVPFYSVESWLYQNTPVAIGLCQRHHGGQHVATFAQWKADRGALDEEHKPKDTACLSDKYNLALATEHFPATAVDSAGKSFHAAVENLRRSPDLVGLLEALSPRAV